MKDTHALRERFERDGVVLLSGALDNNALRSAFDAWSWSMEHPGPLASGLLVDSDEAFQDLCNPDALEPYRELVQGGPLADHAAALWGVRDLWFMYEQVFRKQGVAGRTPWHQDTSYLAVDGRHLIAFWISFERVPRRAALEFVRGSHRGTLYNTSRFDPDDPTLPIAASDVVPNLPDIEADRDAFDIVGFHSEPGDVIAFHTSMLHGGGPTDAATPERRTLTLRFFGPETVSATRPGPSGPFYRDIEGLAPGAPFRHPRFLKVR